MVNKCKFTNMCALTCMVNKNKFTDMGTHPSKGIANLILGPRWDIQLGWDHTPLIVAGCAQDMVDIKVHQGWDRCAGEQAKFTCMGTHTYPSRLIRTNISCCPVLLPASCGIVGQQGPSTGVGFSFILEAGAVSLAAGSEASCDPESTGRHHPAPSKLHV